MKRNKDIKYRRYVLRPTENGIAVFNPFPGLRPFGIEESHLFFGREGQSDEVIKRSVGDFLDRLFGGDPVPLMQYLAEHGKIDADDITRLKKLIGKNKA